MKKVNVKVIYEDTVSFEELLSWQVDGAKFASALRKYRIFYNEDRLSGESTPMEDFKKILKEKSLSLKDVVYFELNAYIHGSISLSLDGFSCPWDSGFAGYVYFEKETLRKFYNVKRITKKIKTDIENGIKNALDNFNSDLSEYIIGIDEEYISGFFEGTPEKDEVKNFILENFILEEFGIENTDNLEFDICYAA